jgi:DNA polymerase-4
MPSSDPEQDVVPTSHRKIIHIDMDAFYASVEQRDNPELRGKPVAVGRSAERGVVAAASYEARNFGVRSAVSSVNAKRQCPDLIFVEPRFEVYKAISRQIRDIFAEHTPIIEPLSLDEAYLDVTENLQGIPLARDIALRIREKIKVGTGLNASAGISYNKFLAKLASDHRKPNAQYVISPEMGPAFVESLPVGKFHGIGPATTAKMNALGIFTGADMCNQTLQFMNANFGKAGAYYYWISRGVDERPVRANRIRKSLGAENTFSTDLTRFDVMVAELEPLINKVWRHCEGSGNRGRTVTLKVKFNDFEIITRSRSVPVAVSSRSDLERLSVALLHNEMPLPKPVRLLGVSLSSLQGEDESDASQLTFLLKLFCRAYEPCMVRSLDEQRDPVVLHFKLLQDYVTIDEFGWKVLEELSPSRGTDLAWLQPLRGLHLRMVRVLRPDVPLRAAPAGVRHAPPRRGERAEAGIGKIDLRLLRQSEREMSRLQRPRFLLCERARQQGVLRRPRTTLAEAPLHRHSARLRSQEPAADPPRPGNDAGVDLRRERRGPVQQPGVRAKGWRRMDDARCARGRKDSRRKLGYGGVSGFPRRGNGDVHLSHRTPRSRSGRLHQHERRRGLLRPQGSAQARHVPQGRDRGRSG